MNIFNLSFGKDSMATLILAAEQGVPIDRVMYVDVKFNEEISGEHPIMAAWIPKAEKRLKELFGITVDHVFDDGVTFESQFFRQYKKGSKIGYIYGFPGIKGAWCNTLLKTQPIRHYIMQFSGTVQFIGIAADEPERWERMKLKETDKRKYRSLLVEQGLTEADALELCKKYDLLSPLYNYEDTYRGGVGSVPSNVWQICITFGKTIQKDLKYSEIWNLFLLTR